MSIYYYHEVRKSRCFFSHKSFIFFTPVFSQTSEKAQQTRRKMAIKKRGSKAVASMVQYKNLVGGGPTQADKLMCITTK